MLARHDTLFSYTILLEHTHTHMLISMDNTETHTHTLSYTKINKNVWGVENPFENWFVVANRCVGVQSKKKCCYTVIYIHCSL